jgi:hypothetical protein
MMLTTAAKHTYRRPIYRPLPNATQLPWLITASNPVGANHRLIVYAFPTPSTRQAGTATATSTGTGTTSRL